MRWGFESHSDGSAAGEEISTQSEQDGREAASGMGFREQRGGLERIRRDERGDGTDGEKVSGWGGRLRTVLEDCVGEGEIVAERVGGEEFSERRRGRERTKRRKRSGERRRRERQRRRRVGTGDF